MAPDIVAAYLECKYHLLRAGYILDLMHTYSNISKSTQPTGLSVGSASLEWHSLGIDIPVPGPEVL